MKVLQVNCHYNYGSTGKIMYDINTYLEERQIDSIQCYSRGKTVKKKNVYRIANEYLCKFGKMVNMFVGTPYAWGEYSTRKLIRIIQKENPDIIHLHCINAYSLNIYSLLNYLKKSKYKVLITLHAEFMHTGGCAHAFECNQWKDVKGCIACTDMKRNSAVIRNTHKNWKNMYDAFQGFRYNDLILVSVSPWLRDRAAVSTILKQYSHKVVLNGIDTGVFTQKTNEEMLHIREKYSIGKKKILLHVTSDFDAPIKGGKFIIDLEKMLTSSGNEEYKIVVVGPARNRFNTENLQFLGIVKNQVDLSILYSMAELTVLTSEKETFSMICAESLCCGTPIVGFKAGAPETIALEKYSRFVEYGDIEELYRCILNVVQDESLVNEQISIDAKKMYSRDLMSENYLSLYRELLNV